MILFNLTVHTELRSNAANLDTILQASQTLYGKFGVTPTFVIQSEPPECQCNVDLFKFQPRQVDALSKFGEIGIHSHFIHNRAPHHQELHIRNALESAKSAGYDPKVWVSGDWIADTYTLEILERLDISFDSSICPSYGIPPHTWTSPKLGYWPKRGNIHRIGVRDHYAVFEVPVTSSLRITDDLSKMGYYTEKQMRLHQSRKDIPIVLPCHSYDFLCDETLWNLMGYLLWLTEHYEVKMVNRFSDFLSYLPAMTPDEFHIRWKDLVKDALGTVGLI